MAYENFLIQFIFGHFFTGFAEMQTRLFLSETVITEVKHHLYAVAGHFERLILIQFN